MKPGLCKTSLADKLVCSRCGKVYPMGSIHTFASCCNQPLLVHYDFSVSVLKEDIREKENSMWRYFEMLPVADENNIVTLGEGMTPLISLDNLAKQYGYSSLLLKDESFNPTGSFKARGISMAISKAKELGISKCIIPTAGNAGGALAAYCARAGMKCRVVMPDHTPEVFKKECTFYGAELELVNGLISDCARKVEEIKAREDFFDLSTLKEPYRLEGKKTMGYEIAEQLDWQLPDAIIYPAGGGTGLIGIWKAFNEMLEMGWINKPLPKMFAAQAENCAPLLAAYRDPAGWKEHFTPLPSIANGLVVPYPFGMDLMLKVIYESGGDVIAISEDQLLSGVHEVARSEGILLSPEGAATWKALQALVQKGAISYSDKLLLLNTGSGYKYLENLDV